MRGEKVSLRAKSAREEDVLTLKVENGFAAQPQPVLVEGGPVDHIRFDLLVDPIHQPLRDGLKRARSVSSAELGSAARSKLTEMIRGAGMQWTNSS